MNQKRSAKSAGPATFYWHDYETFGADPSRDRPVQFAGVRTDADFNIIGEPLMVFCRPADDFLPHPEACLVTGIAPQLALKEGVCEAEFARQIQAELAQPGTCSVGYNSLRFDDEVSRYMFYRNFYDPYGREWQNGNSRWDLIDVLRMARSLRPEGIEWPVSAEGYPSLRLEDLSKANGLAHENAHDALSDVHATIAMAKLLKSAQPKLFEYALNLRDKRYVQTLLDTQSYKPVLHVSSRYPVEQGNAAVVAPLAYHPINKNGVIVYDLRVDPTPLFEYTAEEIRARLYTRTENLSEGEQRIPLKLVHINRCPMIAPANMLNPEEAQRLQISGDDCRTHLAMLRGSSELQEKLAEVYSESGFEDPSDPDLMLYSGGFFSAHDRQLMDTIRQTPADQLADLSPPFQDGRLEEMLFRYRARNWPESLSDTEQERWESFRATRLLSGDSGHLYYDEFYKRLNELAGEADNPSDKLTLLQDLATYAESIYPIEL